MKHYAKTKYMFGEGNRIHHKNTLKRLESLENIKVGTKAEVPSKVKGLEMRLTAVEVDKEKVVWIIE